VRRPPGRVRVRSQPLRRRRAPRVNPGAAVTSACGPCRPPSTAARPPKRPADQPRRVDGGPQDGRVGVDGPKRYYPSPHRVAWGGASTRKRACGRRRGAVGRLWGANRAAAVGGGGGVARRVRTGRPEHGGSGPPAGLTKPPRASPGGGGGPTRPVADAGALKNGA